MPGTYFYKFISFVQIWKRSSISTNELKSESSESDFSNDDSDEEADVDYECDGDTIIQDAVIVLRKNDTAGCNFYGYVMDLQNKAIFELPIKNWDQDNCDYIDDNYYTQYYFKVENEVNPSTHQSQGGSHLGLHDYIKPVHNIFYYV